MQLVINTFGAHLRRQGDRFLVKAKERELAVSAHLESFNARLDKAVRYAVQSKPGRTRNVKRRDVIRFETHGLANRLLGKARTCREWSRRGSFGMKPMRRRPRLSKISRRRLPKDQR